MKKGLIVGAVIALALAGGGAYLYRAAVKARAPHYVTAAAVIGDVEQDVVSNGVLQPADLLDVGAQSSGQVTALNVKLGDHVKTGDVIAVVETFQLQNAVRQAQQQLVQARASLQANNANIVQSQQNVARQEQLASKGFAAESTLDQARYQLSNAQATLAQAQMQIQTQQMSVDAAAKELEKNTIRAPVSGIIVAVVARAGQTINNTQEVPTIVRIATMDHMTVKAEVSEADIIHVRPGQKVYFTVVGAPERKYEATLRTRDLTPVGGQLDPTNGGIQKSAIYYYALLDVDNADGMLLAGMSAEVHIQLGVAKNVLTIPASALGPRNDDGSYVVQVVGLDGKAAPCSIVTGLQGGNLVEVKSGLKVGDRVVVGQSGAAV